MKSCLHRLVGPFQTSVNSSKRAYRGAPATRPSDELSRGPYDKVLEVYDVVRPLYPTPAHLHTFHFAHGDLSAVNILIDPKTGGVTGIVDWEMSGFRPAWLSATAPAWFDNDSCRFVLDDFQEGAYGYEDETESDARLREYFRTQLKAKTPDLFTQFLEGVEFRAIFYILCHEAGANVAGWLEQYEKYEWNVEARGPFPFEIEPWIIYQMDLFDEYVREVGSAATRVAPSYQVKFEDDQDQTRLVSAEDVIDFPEN
jgi:hypothetical protein